MAEPKCHGRKLWLKMELIFLCSKIVYDLQDQALGVDSLPSSGINREYRCNEHPMIALDLLNEADE